MKIERTTNGDLVITNRETFIHVLSIGCAAVLVLVWIAPVPLKQAIGWSVVALVLGLALVAADERSRFVFDHERGVLNWHRETRFQRNGGELPLTAITALSLQRDFTSSGQRSNARRLVVLTTQGPIPVTNAFSGFDRTQEPVGQAVQQFLNERASGQQIPFVTY